MSTDLLMPALTQEEREALKESIRKWGVLVPIIEDEGTGETIDGLNRKAICKELGIEPPIITRRTGSEAERRSIARHINLVRRHIGLVTWGRMFVGLCDDIGIPRGPGRKPEKAPGGLARQLGIQESTARLWVQLWEELEN